ncbi:hypothetical protein LIER_15564 [Lithospermum erythrorhizon]|uniref:Retrotransposon gag domain-containing protein n=1 Tax=Lithospermum erythrorhizon TaxID=34254 RepID=A0AAV3Q3G0_LITER
MPPRVASSRGPVRGRGQGPTRPQVEPQTQANPGVGGVQGQVAIVNNFKFKLEKIFARIGCTDEEMIPDTLRDKKEQEFLTLTQDDMSVLDYETKFNELFQFAGAIVDDDVNKEKRLLKGLRIEIRIHVASHRVTTYANIVERALNVENEEKKDYSESNGGKKQTEYGIAHDSRNCPMLTESCFEYGQLGHHVAMCPRKGTHGMKGVPIAQLRVPFPISQGKKDHQKPKTQGMLYPTNRRDTQASNEMMTGMLLVSSALAYVLFDIGTTHSFMSITYAMKCNVSSEPLDVEVVFDLLIEGCLIGSRFCKSCVIEIEGQELEAELTLLNLKDFDIILGWIG